MEDTNTQVQDDAAIDTDAGDSVSSELGQDSLAGDQSGGAAEETQQAPPTSAPGGTESSSGNAGESTGAVDPLEAEFTAIDALTDQYEKGELTIEQYTRQNAQHQRNITKAQKNIAAEVQRPAQQQKAAKAYWDGWNSAKPADVAQLQFGKTVSADRASILYDQAFNEVQSHPRYKGRKEMDQGTIIYDKWMDKLEAESKKKPVPANTSQSARVTGNSAGAANTGAASNENLTSVQKAARGDYGDLTKLI